MVISHLNEALSIDEESARIGIEQLEAFVGPEPYAIVVDGRDLGYATPDGRTTLRSSVGPHRVATAMEFGSAGTNMRPGGRLEPVPTPSESKKRRPPTSWHA